MLSLCCYAVACFYYFFFIFHILQFSCDSIKWKFVLSSSDILYIYIYIYIFFFNQMTHIFQVLEFFSHYLFLYCLALILFFLFVIPVKLLLDYFFGFAMIFFNFPWYHPSVYLISSICFYHSIVHLGWSPQIYLLIWFSSLLKSVFLLYLFLFAHGFSFLFLS